MIALALILLVAAVAAGAARALRLPVIPFFIAAGMLLPVFGLRQDIEVLRNLFELGLTFLVFAAGSELNPRRAGGRWKAAVVVGLGQFFLLGGIGWFICSKGFGLDVTSSAYLALALAASSTLVVVRHLKEKQRMFEPVGRLVTAVLLLQDLLVIAGLVLLARLPDGWGSVSAGLLGAVLLFALAVVCLRWVTPFFMLGGRFSEEEKLLVTLSLLFIFLGAAYGLGLPLVAGAFFAGVSLSGFPVNGVARGLLRPLVDFFLAAFFVAMGAVMFIPSVPALINGLLLGVFVIVVTPPLVAFLAEWCGLSSRSSIEGGLLLSQTSEFSLIIALQGTLLGHISEEVFAIIGLVTVVTMGLTPFLATDGVVFRLMHIHPLRGRIDRADEKNPVLLLGYGSNGNRLLKPLRDGGNQVVVVDEDAAVIRRLRREGVSCVRGEVSDRRVLERAGIDRAKAVLLSIRRVADAESLLRRIGPMEIPVFVRVFSEEEAARMRKLGALPIILSQAGADAFMEWWQTVGRKTAE